ncbi:DNA-processing protein DprA [Pseudobacteroides cellulosolvens]|uniref:DNA protecting protein DprA n=1 Tax=Pseudobacteroides cellulosolvens ATCC 35603 = DSM 2933 TaxID=398512 RepID=A0A0L6JRS2_9FIRM|nr:DNA-processing protein DprA [Pseudobacteroides cellulosolvens]KNY28390.1 DNA protecting protein DprA [Pseudobacteroides cellulosolvens ATCC 35603 = DSM 2933]
MEEQLIYWVWLNSIPGFGPVKCSKLINFFEHPKNIWHASEAELNKATFLNRQAIKSLMDGKFREDAYKHLKVAKDQKIDIITIRDEKYPYYLKNIYDPPIILYVRGNILKNEKCIAVVGARRATYYGIKMAESLSYTLAGVGLTVVSGMARGIDTNAHKGAKETGRTIGVLGCGADIAYPPENRGLISEVTQKGAVISEYPPGTPPVPSNFPARNRIISGMSIGVVVIEAGERSGSLITAEFALEQGREVFAVPGNISSMNSKGTNKLIKDGAKIVTSVEDILEELINYGITDSGDTKHSYRTYDEALFKGLNSEERKLVECLKLEPLHIDELTKKSGFSIKVVGSLLVMLELKGVVEQIPGKIFRIKD